MSDYQVMPSLSSEEYNELKADISKRGVMIPIEYDENGNILDGHHRLKICLELGIKDFPKVVRTGMSEIEKRTHARKLNMARRHLTQEQRREMIREQLSETPEKSDRQIAAGLGVSNSTVSVTRKEMVENNQVCDSHTSIGADGKEYPRQVQRKSESPPEKDYPFESEPPPPEKDYPFESEPPPPEEDYPFESEITKSEIYTDDINEFNTGDIEEYDTTEPQNLLEQQKPKPHVSNNSGNNEWYTPKEYISAAYEAMGDIDLDPASSDIANKIVNAKNYFTIQNDGLTKKWSGKVWLNPPYSTELIPLFIDKLKNHIISKDISEAIILVNNATETAWFNNLISVCSAIIFPKSRVKFYMPDGKTGTPLQGQAVIYCGENPEKFLEVFGSFGWGATLERCYSEYRPKTTD